MYEHRKIESSLPLYLEFEFTETYNFGLPR